MRKEPIYAIQRPKRDSDGDWITPPDDSGTKIPGCVIWPRAAEEKDGGQVAIDGDNIAAPDNAAAQALTTEDWVRYRGAIYQIDEPPSRFVGKRIFLKTKRARTT
jgi:hypothetical protein